MLQNSALLASAAVTASTAAAGDSLNTVAANVLTTLVVAVCSLLVHRMAPRPIPPPSRSPRVEKTAVRVNGENSEK